MHGPKLKYRYDHYTWPEMKEAVTRQPVCIIPSGSVSDGGLSSTEDSVTAAPDRSP